MADREDIVVNAMQAPERKLPPDLPIGETQVIQLLTRHHPQLPGREPSQTQLTLMAITTATVHIAIRVGHSPTVANEDPLVGNL